MPLSSDAMSRAPVKSMIPVPTSFLRTKKDTKTRDSPTVNPVSFGQSLKNINAPRKRVRTLENTCNPEDKKPEITSNLDTTIAMQKRKLQNVEIRSNLSNSAISSPKRPNPRNPPNTVAVSPAAVPKHDLVPSQEAFAAIRRKCPAWDLKVRMDYYNPCHFVCGSTKRGILRDAFPIWSAMCKVHKFS